MGWSWFGLLIVVVIAWALYTGQLDIYGALLWGFILLIGLPLAIFGVILLIAVIFTVVFT